MPPVPRESAQFHHAHPHPQHSGADLGAVHQPFFSVNGEKEILAASLFIAASITDGIDGYLARKRGQITTMGMLLDPLADKLLIAAAFITLVQFNPRWSRRGSPSSSSDANSWSAACAPSPLPKASPSRPAISANSRWSSRFFPSSPSFSIIAGRSGRFIRRTFFPVHWIAFVAIWFMVVLSLVSAGDYFLAFWNKIDRHVVKRRKRAFILSRRKKRDAAAI